MDNCEAKFGELTRTVATKNITISALVALFNIHNAQTCWLRGLSRRHVRLCRWKWSFPFGVATLDVDRVSEITNVIRNYESSDEKSSNAEFMETAYSSKRQGPKSSARQQGFVAAGCNGRDWSLLLSYRVSDHVASMFGRYGCWKAECHKSTDGNILRSHSASQLAELYLAVVHFGGSVRLHTKKLRKNCP